MLEKVPDGHGLLEDAAVGIALEDIKLAASLEKVFDSAIKLPIYLAESW